MDKSRLDWVVNRYCETRIPIPGAIIQLLLDAYLKGRQLWEHTTGRSLGTPASSSEEIAEKSTELMRSHYDLPLKLFQAFLGPSMKYSMGYWESGANNLEEAQQAMLADLCHKAGISDGQRILDIGCGFGSFANHVLKRFPTAKVYGLTLSRTQMDYLLARQNEAGHPLNSDRFYPLLMDFNQARFDQPFDRVVSIGVFEHISNLSKALEKTRSFIKPKGRLFLHYIAYNPEFKGAFSARQNPFIAKYVFPGGRIWRHDELQQHQGDFTLERQWFLKGGNYQRTLEAWLGNFMQNRAAIGESRGLDRKTLKLWDFYFRACISLFKLRKGTLYGNGQYLLLPR